MNDVCPYIRMCGGYGDCAGIPDDCTVYRSLEHIMTRQVFKSRVIKRVIRREHGHHEDEVLCSRLYP